MKSLWITLCLGVSFVASAAPVASGKVVLPATSVAKAKGIRTLFISVYDARSRAPMPCAAQKFVLAQDPGTEVLSFTLATESLTMMACPAIPDVINLKAKLDRDGSAGPDAPGDIVGTLEGVKKGTGQLVIRLERVI